MLLREWLDLIGMHNIPEEDWDTVTRKVMFKSKPEETNEHRV